MPLQAAEVPDLNARIVVIDTPDKAEQFLHDLLRQSFVAFDTETIGHDPKKESPVGKAECISWSACWSSKETYYIKNYGNMRGMLRKIFKPWLESETSKKRGHNLKYDMHVVANHGCQLRGIDFDSMLGGWLVDENDLKALEVMVFQYFGEKYDTFGQTFRYRPMTKAKARRVAKYITPGLADVINPESPLFQPYKLSKYGAKDSWLSWRLARHVMSLLDNIEWRKNKSLLDYYRLFENPYLLCLYRMERAGAKIDIPYLNGLSDEWGTEMLDIEEKLVKLAVKKGAPQKFFADFNVGSNQQLAKLLYEILEYPTGRETQKGFSVDDAELERLGGSKDPFIGLIQRRRELDKLRGTYANALPLLADKNHRVHTSFNQAGTVTGRLSSSNPNLQNVPIRTEDGSKLRAAFIAEKGNKLIVSDLSQIELRLTAHFAQDKAMIEGFATKEDFHSVTAKRMYSHLANVPIKDIKDKYPRERGNGKTLNFAVNYGAGEKKVAATLGCTREEAREIINLYYSGFAGIMPFKRFTIMAARREGFVRTLLRRYRRLHNINHHDGAFRSYAEREAVNSVVQGSAADIIKMAMILIDNDPRMKELGGELLLQVHDELVAEGPEENAEPIRKIIVQHMQNPYAAFGMKPLVVDTVADSDIANNWKEAK